MERRGRSPRPGPAAAGQPCGCSNLSRTHGDTPRTPAYTANCIATLEAVMSIRPVKRLIRSKPTTEGAGVHLRRAFGFGNTTEFDPFLLLDDFRNDVPEDYLAGFPWHPHRGIETIPYVLAGLVCEEYAPPLSEGKIPRHSRNHRRRRHARAPGLREFLG